jgi:hypothetical protein
MKREGFFCFEPYNNKKERVKNILKWKTKKRTKVEETFLEEVCFFVKMKRKRKMKLKLDTF